MGAESITGKLFYGK